MKRCPNCQRIYTDETLNFCLDDGEWLHEASDSVEPATAILNPEAPTQIHSTPAISPAGSVPAHFALKRRSIVTGVLGVLFAIVLGVAGYWIYGERAGHEIRSVAVLPFENKSGDPDSEYLSDGLTESLIYRLSQLPDLKVSSTSSVFRYKGKEVDPQKVGSELGTGAVMTGRIMQRGGDLMISVELVDASNGKVIWGEQFDRKAADLLATQREIAREIVEKLKLKVSPQENGLAKHYTESNEAYQYFLKGRFYWNKRSAQNLQKAIEQFQQAADADPNFALAYVGLADCYTLLEQYTFTLSSEAVPKAHAAALRALEIDDSLAEAHASLANVNQNLWQPAESEKEYKRAIDLNPNYGYAHHWYSVLLVAVNRPDEAVAEVRRAQQADPLSPIITINVGNQYLLRHEYDRAAAEYQKALELDPNFSQAIADVGVIHARQGQGQDAIAYLQQAVEVSGRANEELAFMGYGYGILGKRAEAMEVLKELEERHARRECPAMYLSAVYAAIGEKDSAFTWLEKDFQARTGLLPFITILPIYDTIRDDPRYTELLRRMGFR